MRKEETVVIEYAHLKYTIYSEIKIQSCKFVLV